MSMVSTKTKARVGGKVAKQAVKHPKFALRGARVAKPIATRAAKASARRTGRDAADQALSVLDGARLLAQAAYQVGEHAALSSAQAQVPRKRTLPRVVVGIAIGAAGMYFLDPDAGGGRRRTVIAAVTSSPAEPTSDTDTGVEAGGPAHPAPGHLPPEPTDHGPLATAPGASA
jgi:hypothetical protein